MEKLFFHNSMLRQAFDAVPFPLFIVDSDVRFLQMNAEALQLSGSNPDMVFGLRGGDALHCLNAISNPDGCGHAEACKDCMIRNSVGDAMRGKKTVRKKTRMVLSANGSETEVFFLVTVSPFVFEEAHCALLFLEDIGEIVNLRSILPICANCKKIRDDHQYWHQVETYLKDEIDLTFSHSICPECSMKLYGQDTSGHL